MRKIFSPSIITILLISFSLHAQEMRIIQKGDAQIISELKGVALFEDGKVLIGQLPDADQRESQYKDLDLKSGDEIQFVNGVRIKSMDDFIKAYTTVKIGDEIKFGVKRESQRFIVAFKKAEEAKAMTRIIKVGPDGKAKDGNVKIEDGKVIIGGKKMDLDSLKKSGGKVIINKSKWVTRIWWLNQ